MINKEVLHCILFGKDNRYQKTEDKKHDIQIDHDWQNLGHPATCQILKMVERICFKPDRDMYKGLVYRHAKN